MNKTVCRIPTFIVALLLISASVMNGQERPKVIFDEDFGQLNDGPMALAMLLQSGEVDVLGVTTVAGGYWVESETAYALRLLEILDRTDIPVYQGAGIPLMGERKSWIDASQRLWGKPTYLGAWERGPRPDSYMELNAEPYGGYPKKKPELGTAVDFIVETVKKYPNEVTIMAIGPMTNVALAIRRNPEIIPLIKQVVYMGGAFDRPGNVTQAAEFNWWFDPESAKITLNTPFKKQIIVPLDVTNTPEAIFRQEHFEEIISGPDTPLVQMYRDIYGARFAANDDSEKPPYSRFVYDALAAAILLRPELVEHIEERYVDIDVSYGLNYGRSVGFDLKTVPWDNTDPENPENFPVGTQKASILFDIDGKGFWDLFIELMTRPY